MGHRPAWQPVACDAQESVVVTKRLLCPVDETDGEAKAIIKHHKNLVDRKPVSAPQLKTIICFLVSRASISHAQILLI